jgi:hypothetical protein
VTHRAHGKPEERHLQLLGPVAHALLEGLLGRGVRQVLCSPGCTTTAPFNVGKLGAYYHLGQDHSLLQIAPKC